MITTDTWNRLTIVNKINFSIFKQIIINLGHKIFNDISKKINRLLCYNINNKRETDITI